MSTGVRNRLLLYSGIGALVVLTLVPLLLPEGSRVLAPLLEKCQEILARCLLALRAAGAPLSWTPVLLLVGGLAYAAIDRVRVWSRLRRLLSYHSLRLPDPDEPIGRLAQELRVQARVHVLVGLAPNPAFTAGILRPRIFIAEALQQTLTPNELRAVFRHEACHLRRRDPLRTAALRFLSKTLLWIPLLQIWIEDLMEEVELIADDFAAAPDGGVDPLDVASALIALGRGSRPTLTGAVSIGGFRLLDRRIRRLAGMPTQRPPRLPTGPALVSAIALAIFWIPSLLHPPLAHAVPMVHAEGACPHRAHPAPERHCPQCHNAHSPMRTCAAVADTEEPPGAGLRLSGSTDEFHP